MAGQTTGNLKLTTYNFREEPWDTGMNNNLNVIDQHVTAIELGAFAELVAARGTQPSLDARLDISLNEDGSLKVEPVLNLFFGEVQAARGSMGSLDARLDAALNEDGTLKDQAILDEVVAARGTQPSLDARLDAALNEDGTLIEGILGQVLRTGIGPAAGWDWPGIDNQTGAKRIVALPSTATETDIANALVAYDEVWLDPTGVYVLTVQLLIAGGRKLRGMRDGANRPKLQLNHPAPVATAAIFVSEGTIEDIDIEVILNQSNVVVLGGSLVENYARRLTIRKAVPDNINAIEGFFRECEDIEVINHRGIQVSGLVGPLGQWRRYRNIKLTDPIAYGILTSNISFVRFDGIYVDTHSAACAGMDIGGSAGLTTNVIVDGLYVNGNGVSSRGMRIGSGPGQYVSDSEFKNLEILGTAHFGIEAHLNNCKIGKHRVEDNAFGGIFANEYTGAEFSYSTVEDGVALTNTGTGYWFSTGGENITGYNLVSRKNTERQFRGGRWINCLGDLAGENTAFNVFQDPYYALGCKATGGINIAGNGFFVTLPDVLIQSCKAENLGGNGFQIGSIVDGKLSNNISKNNTGWGFLTVGLTGHLHGNTATGNGAGQYSVGGGYFQDDNH